MPSVHVGKPHSQLHAVQNGSVHVVDDALRLRHRSVLHEAVALLHDHLDGDHVAVGAKKLPEAHVVEARRDVANEEIAMTEAVVWTRRPRNAGHPSPRGRCLVARGPRPGGLLRDDVHVVGAAVHQRILRPTSSRAHLAPARGPVPHRRHSAKRARRRGRRGGVEAAEATWLALLHNHEGGRWRGCRCAAAGSGLVVAAGRGAAARCARTSVAVPPAPIPVTPSAASPPAATSGPLLPLLPLRWSVRHNPRHAAAAVARQRRDRRLRPGGAVAS
mmetsp:Transcript_51184/g.165765  ORF Transcript_51184/g.165765 Transcript_51184/m.165765 type:complete len:274 (-) Transcript_51184:1713-2534(-)